MSAHDDIYVHISEDVWVARVLPACDSQSLGRLAQTCRAHHRGVEHYRRGRACGAALARGAISYVRNRLAAQHELCEAEETPLPRRIDAYLARMCVGHFPLEPGPGGAMSERRMIAAAVAGRTAEQIVGGWDKGKLAAFLLPFAARLSRVSSLAWDAASEATIWGLRATGFDVLTEVFTAPSPLDALDAKAEAPPHVALVRLAKAISTLSLYAAPTRDIAGALATHACLCIESSRPDDLQTLQIILAGAAIGRTLSLGRPTTPAVLLWAITNINFKAGAGWLSLPPLEHPRVRCLRLTGPRAEITPLNDFVCTRKCVSGWAKLLALTRGLPPACTMLLGEWAGPPGERRRMEEID
jgi:hypothetical protein